MSTAVLQLKDTEEGVRIDVGFQDEVPNSEAVAAMRGILTFIEANFKAPEAQPQQEMKDGD